MKGFNVMTSKTMKGVVLRAVLFCATAVASASSFNGVATVNSFNDFRQKHNERFTIHRGDRGQGDRELIDDIMEVCWKQRSDIFRNLPIDASHIDILIRPNHFNELVRHSDGMFVPFSDRKYVSSDKGNVLCTRLVSHPAPMLDGRPHAGEVNFDRRKNGANVFAIGAYNVGVLFYSRDISSVTMQITNITVDDPTYGHETFECFEVVDVHTMQQ